MVNSFYDPVTEEGCAFEELISFHGGLGGPQTRPFLLHPAAPPVPAEPLVGAEAIHRLLRGWRQAGARGYSSSDSPGDEHAHVHLGSELGDLSGELAPADRVNQPPRAWVIGWNVPQWIGTATRGRDQRRRLARRGRRRDGPGRAWGCSRPRAAARRRPARSSAIPSNRSVSPAK